MGYWIDDLKSDSSYFIISFFLVQRMTETCEKWLFCRIVSNDFCRKMKKDGVK